LRARDVENKLHQLGAETRFGHGNAHFVQKRASDGKRKA